MGACQSTQDAILPSGGSSVFENKFKVLQKYLLKVPPVSQTKLQTYTSTGKITDFITRNQAQVQLLYHTLKVADNLDSTSKFFDKSFAPTQQSLGRTPYPQKIEWKRASQFIGAGVRVFEGQIEPRDVRQGRLGDCYLLSAITAISQYPFVVKRILQSTQESSYGYYGVWLFVDGIWRCVVVDDYFPLHNNKVFFSRNHEGQIWVMLVEKAYAKVFGSYQAISSGLAGVALNSLTAAPYEYLSKDSTSSIDVEVAWGFLKSHIAANHLLVGSTENNDRNAYLGLVSVHAYTVLDIQQVHVAARTGVVKERILKLSNPWGRYEWKGRWSEYSDVWSEELRRQLQYDKAEDGIFWICVEDFVQNFGQLCACKYNKNYISTSLPLQFPQQLSGFKGVFLQVASHTEGYLSLIQRDHRFFLGKYQYSLVRVVVLRVQNGHLSHYVADTIDCDHDATIQLSLEPGCYYVAVEVDWKSELSRTLVLHFYGQHPLAMVQDSSVPDLETLFNEIVLLHESTTELQRVYRYGKDESIVRTTGTLAGYVYYHYSNHSTCNNYLCETVSLRERKHIAVHAEKGVDQFTVKVYPEEERIVRLRVAKEGNSYYSFSTKIQYYIVEKYSLEKLKELADKKPTKVKKREVEKREIDVRVKTYNYSGGVVLLYQNKMDKYAYIEEITFQIENLYLENETLPQNKKLQIQLEPQAQKLLSFVMESPGKEIVFKTKMSFYLNAPEFKF